MSTTACSYFYFVMLFTGILITHKSQSQPRNIFKVNLLSPAFRSVSIAGEHLLNPDQSLQIGFFYTGIRQQEISYQGFGLTPEYRFYLDKFEAPAGFFISTFLRHHNLKMTNSEKSEKARLLTYGGGISIGGQWVFDYKFAFTLEIYGGLAYDLPHLILKEGAKRLSFDTGLYSGFNPRFGLTMGWAF